MTGDHFEWSRIGRTMVIVGQHSSTGDDSAGHDLLFFGCRAPPPHALLPRADNNEGVLLFSRTGPSRCQNRAIIVALSWERASIALTAVSRGVALVS